MTIFDLLKKIKQQDWYIIPVDADSISHVTVIGMDAIKLLVAHRNSYARGNMVVHFKMTPSAAIINGSLTPIIKITMGVKK